MVWDLWTYMLFWSFLKFLCVVKFSLKDSEAADYRCSTKWLFWKSHEILKKNYVRGGNRGKVTGSNIAALLKKCFATDVIGLFRTLLNI